MAWTTQIPTRTGWYWVRSTSPQERRIVFLDYPASTIFDARKTGAGHSAAAPIFDYARPTDTIEWYCPELRPPPG